jgi:hypothetical protein
LKVAHVNERIPAKYDDKDRDLDNGASESELARRCVESAVYIKDEQAEDGDYGGD